MWYKITSLRVPQENVPLECTTPSGDVVNLVRRGNLYFDGDMYMYYTPMMWRYKEDCPCGRRY